MSSGYTPLLGSHQHKMVRRGQERAVAHGSFNAKRRDELLNNEVFRTLKGLRS